jgi:hypothetical protein
MDTNKQAPRYFDTPAFSYYKIFWFQHFSLK